MIKWRAACTQCPKTIDPGYGHDVPVYVDYIDSDNAYIWAWMHYDVTGHTIRVTQMQVLDVRFDKVDPEIFNLLFGIKDE